MNVNLEPLDDFLATQTDIVAAYLFGSVAQGQDRTGSDIDIAILLCAELDPRARDDRYLLLMAEIQHVLRGHKVDVVLLNTAPPLLRYEVLRHGKLIYEADRQARVNFEVYAGQQYEDVKPMYAFHNQDLLQKIKEVGISGRRRRSAPTPQKIG